jgi:hypothetical protein
MNLIEGFDNYFENLKNNKNVMLITTGVISIMTVYLSYGVPNAIKGLFNNMIFKFIIFCIISFISNKNPALGVILAIFVLTVFQMITYNDLSSYEEFKHLNGKLNSYEDYLNKPLLQQNTLNPINSNYDYKTKTPDEMYIDMIQKGRVLLDDSDEINKEFSSISDDREKEIVENTKRDGLNLIQSGLNRLQVSNQGEYGINNNTENNKFINYDKLIENYSNNPQIMSAFNELKYNFNKLHSSVQNEGSVDNFDNKLDKIYDSEIQLLELIYKNKKNSFSIEKQNEINKVLDNIKNIKLDTNMENRYPLLLENIKNIVEYLS